MDLFGRVEGRVERRVVVIDAQAAAGVDVADVVAIFFEVGDEANDSGSGGGEWFDVTDLRADVDADACGVEPFGFCGGAVDGAGGVDVDAEFVFAETGGDVGVGIGEDVRVDAEGEAGAELEGFGASGEEVGSASDSTLKRRMLARRAASISQICLPTPEKTTFLRAGLWARRTRSSSPPDTMSKPAPCRARSRRMARDELALTA